MSNSPPAAVPRGIPIATVIERAGGKTKLARAVGVSRSSVYDWQQVPPRHCQTVARLIGCQPEELRPDIYLPQKD